MTPDDLIKLRARKVVDNGVGPHAIPLAQLTESILLNDKLDALTESIRSIEIPEYPEIEIPEYPTEITVANLPDVQKVELVNPPKDKDDKEQLKILKEIASELKKKEQYAYDIEIDSDLKDQLRGEQGEPGASGSPDTPDQIAEKLNTLEEQVELSVLKGWKEFIANLGEKTSATRVYGTRMLRNLVDVIGSKDATTGQVLTKQSDGTFAFETPAAGGSAHIIQDEGVSVTNRSKLNFIGTGVTVTDNAGSGATDVTITSGGGSGDVVGPASAVNNNFAAFDTTTGKLIKDSGSKASDFATAAQGTKADNAVVANTAITGATKTKITYDAKGLVTSGADATTADIADSLNKRYVTDAQLTVIGNTSGLNTGDQTITLTGEVTGSGAGSFAATVGNSAVIGKVLTGLSLATSQVIAATDTVLQAFGYLQAQITAITSTVLKLDQTTPQTVINGWPIFDWGIKTYEVRNQDTFDLTVKTKDENTPKAVYVQGGDTTGTTSTGGDVFIKGGMGSTSTAGGSLTLQGGPIPALSSTNGSHVYVSAGRGMGGGFSGGNIYLQTGSGESGASNGKILMRSGLSASYGELNVDSLTATRVYTLPDKSGTVAMTSDITGVSDGDKGDITVSGSGATWTIDNGVVSLAKLVDMATGSLFYRKTAGSGAPEVQTLATLKTDLGLTGTNSGDQTTIVGIVGTKAQFDTAVTDGNFLYVGDVTQYTDELAQDAVGGMVDTSLVYNDATPSLSRAALTGAITASAGSNTTSLGSFTTAQLNAALSDNDIATGGGTATGTNTGDNAVNSLYSGLASSKQDTLVSGTNIKTVNSTSLLGGGDITLFSGLSKITVGTSAPGSPSVGDLWVDSN